MTETIKIQKFMQEINGARGSLIWCIFTTGCREEIIKIISCCALFWEHLELFCLIYTECSSCSFKSLSDSKFPLLQSCFFGASDWVRKTNRYLSHSVFFKKERQSWHKAAACKIVFQEWANSEDFFLKELGLFEGYI